MQDIYKPPESNLDTEKRIRPHGFWRFFFWFNLTLSPLVLLIPFYTKGLKIYDYVDLVTLVPQLIMLFGYAYSKRIFTSTFWKRFFIVYLSWTIVYGFVMPYGLDMPQYGEQRPIDSWLLLELVFFILCGLPLYFYAYKSEHIWLKRD